MSREAETARRQDGKTARRRGRAYTFSQQPTANSRAATADAKGRPRSRVLHPIWEGAIAWVSADPDSPKGRDLAASPFMSLAYVSDPFNPAYAECGAEWIADRETKQHVWDLLLSTPPPVGFDPGPIYSPVDTRETGRPCFGILKLTPYRITLSGFPDPATVWTPG